MKAYLLAAGYATRMYPLTRDRPKPLLEVGGQPILTHLVRRIETLGALTGIVVVGNHRFAEPLARWRDATACRVPVRVLDDGSTGEHDRLGAIGDLAFALREVPAGGEDWVVAAGDNLLSFDLRAIEAEFLAHHAPTIVVRDVPTTGTGAASRYNEVTLDAGGRVVRFREKPDRAMTGIAAIALYVFPPDVAGLVTQYLAEGGNPDAPGHLIAWLVGQRTVRASRFEGEWFDIGSLEALAGARERFRSGGP